MKILHLNTFAQGGAAKACIRLHQGLLEQGVDSNILFLEGQDINIPKSSSVQKQYTGNFNKFVTDQRLIFNKVITQVKLKKYEKGEEIFAFLYSLIDIMKHPMYKEADIVNLHWVTGLLNFNKFFKQNKKPLFWTLHDKAPFTGGNHYDSFFPLKSYETIIKKNYKKKQRLYRTQKSVDVVSPSKWLKNESEKSKIWNDAVHHLIPYGLDQSIFTNHDIDLSRRVLGLPNNKKIILFVADSITQPRKGLQFLLDAIKNINREDLIVCTVGGIIDTTPELPELINLGYIGDERLMGLVYSAADIFVIPSLEDNLPNTVLESLMCGTPVIGFNVGGIPDMIEDGVNGKLCYKIDSANLREIIIQFLNNNVTLNRNQIREKAITCYALEKQAKSYINLYKKVLGNV